MAKKAKKAKKAAKARAEGSTRGDTDKKLDMVLAELTGVRAELKRLHSAVRVLGRGGPERTAEDMS